MPHTHSHSLSHTHTLSLTHTHSLSLTHTNTNTYTHTYTHTYAPLGPVATGIGTQGRLRVLELLLHAARQRAALLARLVDKERRDLWEPTQTKHTRAHGVRKDKYGV